MKIYPIYAIILLITFICSCSNINTITSKNDFTYTEVGDVFLNDQIRVEDIKINESENGKAFNVMMKNLMWFDMNLEVKMDFYDRDGIKLDNPWGWKPFTLEQGQSDWIKFISPNKNTRNFKLYMKKAEL